MLRPMTSRVLSERRGDAVLVTLNAPERRNAIDQEMVDGLGKLGRGEPFAPACGLEDGVLAIEVVDALERSRRTGGARVELSRP